VTLGLDGRIFGSFVCLGVLVVLELHIGFFHYLPELMRRSVLGRVV